MTQAARFPQNIAIQQTWTTSVAGMGTWKTNDKEPDDPERNPIAEEENQRILEIIAVQKSVGRIRSTLSDYGDADEKSLRERLNYMAITADRVSFVEHFIRRAGAGASDYVVEINSSSSVVTSYTDRIGVRRIVLGATLQEGWQSDLLFYQRSSVFKCAFKLSALPASSGDYIRCGLYNSSTGSYVWIESSYNGSSWEDWDGVVDDTATSETVDFTSAPDTSWHTFEIFTSDSTVDFWLDRGTSGQEKKSTLGTCVPENALSAAVIQVYTGGAGGQNLDTDLIACRDTREF